MEFCYFMGGRGKFLLFYMGCGFLLLNGRCCCLLGVGGVEFCSFIGCVELCCLIEGCLEFCCYIGEGGG